jgi:hypothetical protein
MLWQSLQLFLNKFFTSLFNIFFYLSDLLHFFFSLPLGKFLFNTKLLFLLKGLYLTFKFCFLCTNLCRLNGITFFLKFLLFLLYLILDTFKLLSYALLFTFKLFFQLRFNFILFFTCLLLFLPLHIFHLSLIVSSYLS